MCEGLGRLNCAVPLPVTQLAENPNVSVETVGSKRNETGCLQLHTLCAVPIEDVIAMAVHDRTPALYRGDANEYTSRVQCGQVNYPGSRALWRNLQDSYCAEPDVLF